MCIDKISSWLSGTNILSVPLNFCLQESLPTSQKTTLVAAFTFGAISAWFVDYLSTKEYDLEKMTPYNRWKTPSFLYSTTTVVLGSAFSLSIYKILPKAILVAGSLSLGAIVGNILKEKYNQYAIITKIAECLQSTLSNGIQDCELNLGRYYQRIKHLHLESLRRALSLGNNVQQLVLKDCQLTNKDLKRLSQAGWFSHFKHLDLSSNPLITSEGMIWVSRGSSGNIETLDISENHPLVEINQDSWLQEAGFNNLHALEIIRTDLTEEKLKHLINSTPWVRRLQGLNVSWNSTLQILPDNLNLLTHLNEHNISEGVLRSGGHIYFQGKGLFFRGYEGPYSLELAHLCYSDKAFGGKLEVSCGIAERLPFERFFALVNR